jgi:apolipoprotein N-acyltransferase
VGEAPEWVAAAALLTMLALGLRGGARVRVGRVRRGGGADEPDTTKDEDDDDAA